MTIDWTTRIRSVRSLFTCTSRCGVLKCAWRAANLHHSHVSDELIIDMKRDQRKRGATPFPQASCMGPRGEKPCYPSHLPPNASQLHGYSAHEHILRHGPGRMHLPIKLCSQRDHTGTGRCRGPTTAASTGHYVSHLWAMHLWGD